MSRSGFSLTLAAFILSIGSVLTAVDTRQPSKIFPYQYLVRDLENGLRIIVVPTDYPNIVSLQIPVRTGSRNEVEAGKSGFAHFFEHVMFRGTPEYPAARYNAILKDAGADQNAYTTDDFTNYHTTFSKEDLETLLKLEADRFQHLEYSPEAFKTEARSVLGEYNKNFANPVRRIFEAQRDVAFREHTYKHTTMGFISDIENMPNQYDYSLRFFDHYYRPEYTTLILAGDVEPDVVFGLVEKYWSGWKKGSFHARIPPEPEADGPVYRHLEWTSPTLPWMTVAFHGPAFSESRDDMIAMDILQSYAFSPSSPLYQKLVVEEQKVDQLFPYFPDRRDPFLVTVAARVKESKDLWYVRDKILRTFAQLRSEPVSAKRLADIKGNLKYSFANSLDNSEAIADALVGYVALTRDPETINRVYKRYDDITARQIRAMANRYFTDKGMVVVTLAHGKIPEVGDQTASVDALVAAAAGPAEKIETVLIRNHSPIINFRFLFNVGAALDPPGQEGLASLTAAMIAQGASQQMSHQEVQERLFPLAASFGSQVDKEMTVFQGSTHRDNLTAYHDIVAPLLLQPAWDPNDFRRVKTNLINAIKVNLRDNNDEELGKEVLYEMIYAGHPYGHLNLGHIDSLKRLELDDVQRFYREHYTRANLVLGLAGDFSDSYLNRLERELGALPQGSSSRVGLPRPAPFNGLEAELIEKDTRATAISFGFPIEVNRSHPDFPALWLVRSYFGEHRSTNSHLFQRIREVRGMNYGDYAYVEYFPRGMFQFHPDPNLGRQQQIFQVWIRPVVPANAHFAIRAAMYELHKLIQDGMSREDFEATRKFLLKFVHILEKTQDRQLGYALDSRFYGTAEFARFISDSLQKLTLEDVNRAIRRHLQDSNVKFAIITREAQGLKERLVNNTPSPIQYDAPKPPDVLAEDEIIQNYRLSFRPEKVRVRRLEEVFDSQEMRLAPPASRQPGRRGHR
ncbi:MAG: M16 family metallopeptidase [Acidobacteriota bacterium]